MTEEQATKFVKELDDLIEAKIQNAKPTDPNDASGHWMDTMRPMEKMIELLVTST